MSNMPQVSGKGWLQPIDVLKFLGFILPTLIVTWVFFSQIHETLALQGQRIGTIEGNHLLHIQDSIKEIEATQAALQKDMVQMQLDTKELLTIIKGYDVKVTK